MRKEGTPFKGTRDLRKDPMVSSLGFLIVWCIPELELRTLAIQASQQMQRTKKPHKSLLSSQRNRRGDPSKTEYF